jgi:hypothetical protein
MYQPDAANPYLMLAIGGKMIQVRVDTDNSVVDVTDGFTDPANVPQVHFCQAENFLIKQAGDGVTLPLFWDGATLRRSNGVFSGGGGGGGGAIPGPSTLPSYPLNTIAAFTMPAAGGSVTIQLASPYPGNIGDNVFFEYVSGKGVALASFNITGKSGNNISVKCVWAKSPSSSYTPDAIVLNVAGLTVRSDNTGYSFIPFDEYTTPADGASLTINLGAEYPGCVGDVLSMKGFGNITR